MRAWFWSGSALSLERGWRISTKGSAEAPPSMDAGMGGRASSLPGLVGSLGECGGTPPTQWLAETVFERQPHLEASRVSVQAVHIPDSHGGWTTEIESQ